MKESDYNVLQLLKNSRNRMKPQQYRTIRGQIFSGDSAGAMKGLEKLLKKGQKQNV